MTRHRHLKRFAVGVVLVVAAAWPVRAQIVIHDPALTLRTAVTATIDQYVLSLQDEQRRQIGQMAARLSQLTELNKYGVTDTPEWRIHIFLDTEAVLFARDYNAALNYGDGSGAAYLGITEPVLNADSTSVPGGLDSAAGRAFAARLATVNVADAVAISATNDDGLLRFNGRREQEAIEALEGQVVDPSQTQSTTAVLDKISGAQLVGVRQRQARMQFLVDIVEQLVVDTKRARDADATALNMQLTTWREAKGANDAFALGTGDALSRWRQP